MNKYPEYVMTYLRARRGLEPNDTSEDDAINAMSVSEALSEVMAWNGLLGGWAGQIKGWIKDIYGIDLDMGV